MAKKPDVMSDNEIVARVLQKSAHSRSWADSKLAKERERVTNYLNGVWPKRQSEGSSSYISSDVYDSVEMQKAQLLEVFAGGDQIVRFDPDQVMNAQDCMVATEYASYVLFRLNNGYNIFDHVMYDALTARAGVVKVYWEEKYEYSEEEFDDIDEMSAHGLAAQDDVDEFEANEKAPGAGVYSGTLVRKKKVSKTCIDNIAPEEFLIDTIATSIQTATYCGHRTPKTKAELIDMGYDRKKVMAIPSDDAKELLFSPEVVARTNATRAFDSEDDPIQDELQYLVYYESYVRMQIDASKGVRLYKICHAGTELLDKQEVDRAPFFAYIPLPVPHVFYGNNFAQRCIPTQNARTVLLRGVLDHTAITNNARYAVVNGGLLNPRELLDNRLGGIVNVRRPDSVAPLPQTNLNPYVFQTLELLTQNNEKSTGISSLSQGLNKDAISTQNSKGLVDNMMRASGQRGKIMARNFAFNFLVPLMIEIVRLGILYKDQRIIEVAGVPMQIDAQHWSERTSCSVSQHLGYGEKDMAAAELTQGYELMAKDPALQNAFGLPQKYSMLKDVAKLKGFSNFSNYLDPNAPPVQPDPIKMQELQIKDKSANANIMQAQGAQTKESRLAALDQSKLQIESANTQLKALDHDRTHNRQDAETASRIQVAETQLGLEKQALHNDRAKIEVMASKPTRP